MIDPITQPVAYIQQAVAREFDLPRRIIVSATRGTLAEQEARMAAMFVARLLSLRSSSHLARYFRRDPRTFANGVLRTWEKMQDDEQLRRRVAAAVEKLRAVSRPEIIGDTPCIYGMIGAKEMGSPVVEAELPTLAEATAND